MRKSTHVTWQEIHSRERDGLGLNKDTDTPDGVGLALSGGGIRSAVFSLGVLQFLASTHCLYLIDYLSTVSGGGYVGAWLSTYLKRLSPRPSGAKPWSRITETQEAELARWNLPSIRFMRHYSNYVTPRTGLSRDVLSTLGVVIDNLSISIILVSLLLLALSFSVLCLAGFASIVIEKASSGAWLIQLYVSSMVLAPIAMLCFKPALEKILSTYKSSLAQVSDGSRTMSPKENYAAYRKLEWSVVAGSSFLYLALGALSLATLTWYFVFLEGVIHKSRAYQFERIPVPTSTEEYLGLTIGAACVLYFIINFPLVILRCLITFRQRRALVPAVLAFVRHSVDGLAAGALGGATLFGLHFALAYVAQDSRWVAIVMSIPITVATAIIAMSIHLMLLGRRLVPEIREWWYRIFSALMLTTLAWFVLSSAAVVGPALFREDSVRWISAAVLTWTGASIFSTLIAVGKFAGKPGENKLLTVLTPVAAWIVIAGLVLAAFAAAYHILGVNPVAECKEGLRTCVGVHADNLSQYFGNQTHGVEGFTIAFIALAITSLCLALFNIFYNVNTYAMNQLYRDRLVRCFLGATNASHDERNPSGFDHRDDCALARLDGQRPLHVYCASINLSGSQELAWQTRKALSFTFTPMYVGYRAPQAEGPQSATGTNEPTHDFFVPTEAYLKSETDSNGITVGGAMSISGAAASPNMGYHTNKGFAFLMALANVRIGRWCPNPRQPFINRLDPVGGVWWFVKELFGWANERGSFVYVSDGGHFDNTGIYELIRRRCKTIVVVDAEQDASFKTGGLTEAIRKARIDLNAEVTLNLATIRPPQGSRHSKHSFAIGKIIYDQNPSITADVLYLKLSLPELDSPCVPADVWGYAAEHPQFPHESTADQWFDETQFEAYRKLGYAIAEAAFSEETIARTLAPDPTSARFAQ